uniref:Uncharacterized protein n=1 Tax=Rhizophora mucronata TaxID=61149 RepID=A0A2P2K2M6_RHIMU
MVCSLTCSMMLMKQRMDICKNWSPIPKFYITISWAITKLV